MPKKATCLKVPKQQGEKILVLANRLKLIDKQLKIDKNGDFLYVPLVDETSPNDLKVLGKGGISLEVSNRLFEGRSKKTSLLNVLESRLPPHLLARVPHSTDFIGDIAIIEIPSELRPYQEIVGEAILEVNKNVRTVLSKAGAVGGTYRLREFNVIAGESSTETIHKESGCRFKVDVAKAYFSPRLSYERRRVASLVREGETIIDLFAGVGPFAILIAKTHRKVEVYAVDANPHAVEYLKINIRLNRVINKVHALLGDARQIADERLSGIADRIIMNLPEKAIEFVDTACRALRSDGGIIHFYNFVDSSCPIENMKLHFKEAIEKSGRRVEEFLSSRLVRETAPYEWQAVLDVRIR